MKIKMYTLVSLEAVKAMGGNRGKLMAQGQHAVLHTFWDAERRFPEMAQAYRDSSHAYKIALQVASAAELAVFHEAYKDICGISLVKDAGFTVFKEPTITCLGIGPIREDQVLENLSSLTTFK